MWHEEQLFIGGELRAARNGSTFENINPATEELLGVSADANEEDFDNAIAAARSAFDAGQWSTDLDFRLHCLDQLHQALVNHVEELTEITIAEVRRDPYGVFNHSGRRTFEVSPVLYGSGTKL